METAKGGNCEFRGETQFTRLKISSRDTFARDSYFLFFFINFHSVTRLQRLKKIERESKRWEWRNSRGPLMGISLPPCFCSVREEKGNDITLKTVQYVFYTFCSGHCTCSCYKYYTFVSIVYTNRYTSRHILWNSPAFAL